MLAKEERKHFKSYWDCISNGVSDTEVSNIFFPKSSLMRFRSRLIINFPADNLPFMLAERVNTASSKLGVWNSNHGMSFLVMYNISVIVVINIMGVSVIGWILNSFSYRRLVDFLSLPRQEWQGLGPVSRCIKPIQIIPCVIIWMGPMQLDT